MTAQPPSVRCDFTDLIVAQCAHCIGGVADGGGAVRANAPRRRGGRAAAEPERPNAPRPRGRRGQAAVHVCLSCGGGITAGQPEERIPAARGAYRGSSRYRHARPEDCQAALRRPPGGNVALIGRYRELAPLRVVKGR